MKALPCLLVLALLASPLAAQQMEYVDDETCGCELFFIDGIQTTTDGTLFGFKRADGTQIAPNIYRYVDKFHDGYCKVYLDDGQCGMIDRDGNQIVPCIYDDMEYPSCGRILAYKDNLFGYLDLQGRVRIPMQYLRAGSFSEDRAQVLVVIDSFSSGCTYIDTTGRQLFPPVFDNAMPYSEGYAPVFRYQRWGLIDRDGREVLPIMYESMTTNHDSVFFAGSADGMALFDYNMKPLTDFVYTWVNSCTEGLIGVRRDDKYGFIDRHGREVIPCIYDGTGIFQQGRTMVCLGNHYGIIDTTGRVVLPIEYDDKTPKGMKYMYYDSLALVEKDGKLGFVDLEGNIRIPFYFEEAYNFSQGLACVKYNGMWGYVDTRGKVFLPFIFDHASPYQWGRAEVVYNGNVSKVDLKGKCVKNCNGIIAWRTLEE